MDRVILGQKMASVSVGKQVYNLIIFVSYLLITFAQI